MSDQRDRLRAALAGRYDVVREVGRGGMATVYLARDLRHERDVALKVLRPDLAAAIGPERFLREIKIAAALQHPHILPVHDSGDADGLLYYVMPYVEGESLREHLRSHGEMPVPDAVRVLRDVAEALAAAHAKGVVHRDIKPDNVLLSGRNALVSDFGVAKAVTAAAGSHDLTSTGVALGTPAYMAPEQATAGHVDHRADLYAFGVLAYEMLTGHPPFEGATAQALLAAHVADEAPSVTSVRATVPAALDALVMKCLAKRAADRWQSAEELLPVLEAVSTPAAGVTPTGTVPVPVRRAPAGRRATAAGALIVVLAVAGYAVWRLVAPSRANNQRVAVMPFENRTGNDSLDNLGLVLADVITTDLDRSGIVEAVPTATMGGVLRDAGKGGGMALTPQFIGNETDAGLVVTGSYDIEDDSLAVRPQVVDVARDRTAVPVKAVLVPGDDIRGAVDQVRQRVRIALSAVTDAKLGDLASSDLPVSLAAYGKYVDGYRQAWAYRFGEALKAFSEAMALDSASVAVRIQVALYENNAAGNTGKTDSLLRTLAPRRAEMTPTDRYTYDWLRAWVDGDLEGVHHASAHMDRQTAAQGAYWSNYWDEARRDLDESGRKDLIRRNNFWYWLHLDFVEHWYGAYQRELDAARRALEEFGHDPRLVGFEIRALAALGRGDELMERMEALRAEDPTSDAFWTAARELRLHGHPALADSVGRVAVAWYRRAFEKDSTVSLRRALGTALFDLGRLDEARAVIEPLGTGDPSRAATLWALGYLGVIAARRGDSVGAEAYVDQLGRISIPYAHGRPVWRQGEIAANLGQCDRAVAYLAAAARQGTDYTAFVDGRDTPDALFTPIGTCPAFRRFVAPKQ